MVARTAAGRGGLGRRRRTAVTVPRSLVLSLACGSVVAAACSPTLPEFEVQDWRLSTDPADHADAIARRGRITVETHRLVLPSCVTQGAIQLRSGAVSVPIDLRIEPVPRQIWITWRGALESETTYQLRVAGLVDLDGSRQPTPHTTYFTTSTQQGEQEPDARVDASAVMALLAARCASAHCHDAMHAESMLDLSNASGIERTARNRAAQVADDSDRPAPLGSLSHAAVVILDAHAGHGDPARSYLVYKLLGDEHILGDPMPPPGETALSNVELQLIVDWIRVGAPTG